MNEVEMYLRSFSLALKNEDLLNSKAKAFHMFVLVVMIMILSVVLSAKILFGEGLKAGIYGPTVSSSIDKPV